FQAEDGIRDFHVTGVQTCALPISTIRILSWAVMAASNPAAAALSSLARLPPTAHWTSRDNAPENQLPNGDRRRISAPSREGSDSSFCSTASAGAGGRGAAYIGCCMVNGIEPGGTGRSASALADRAGANWPGASFGKAG